MSAHLLWEFDADTIDFSKHYRIIIERIIERGGMDEWRGAVKHYGVETICEVAKSSKGLSDRNRNFALLFARSPLVA